MALEKWERAISIEDQRLPKIPSERGSLKNEVLILVITRSALFL